MDTIFSKIFLYIFTCSNWIFGITIFITIKKLKHVPKNSGNICTVNFFDKKKKVSVKELERKLKLGKEANKQVEIWNAKQMAAKGMGASEIGRKLGKNESTIRGWLDESTNQSICCRG